MTVIIIASSENSVWNMVGIIIAYCYLLSLICSP